MKSNNNIYNIEAQIEAKDKLLKENYKKIQEKSKQNELLIDVLEDYRTYMEKNQLHQEKFQILNKYISSLLENKSLSKNDIQNLKREKKEIEKILDKNK